MLRMVAFGAGARAVAHIDRAPGGEERRQRADILGRRVVAAEGEGEARIAGVVAQALCADRVEPVGDDVERFLPRDRHEAGILVPALARVGPLHRLRDAVRVVGFLDQPVGLDADPPAGRMLGDVEIRFDPQRHAVPHLDLHQVGARGALVAVDRNLPAIAAGHGAVPPRSGNGRGAASRDYVNFAPVCL